MPTETVSERHISEQHTRWAAVQGINPDCPPCDEYRAAEVEAQVRRDEAARELERVNQRMADENLVRCSHAYGTCSQRDGDSLVPAALASECPHCYEWFCDVHHHDNPSGVPTQRCGTCDNFAPRCIGVWTCDDCNNRICDRCNDNHFCESGDEFDGENFETPGELTFAEGPPHPLALGRRFIGFEVECENGSWPSLPERFGIHTDGSLSNGVEVVTPPAKGEALVHDIEMVMDHLKERGWDVDSGSAGMHTHIDMRDKRDDMVFLSRLFAAFYAVEDVLFALTLGREDSHWCAPLRSNYTFYEMFGQSAPDFDFKYYKIDKTMYGQIQVAGLKTSHEGMDRYRSFNFQSIFFRGSLEVRMKEGCLDAVEALRWADTLQFIVAGVERGITYKRLEKLLTLDADETKAREMCRVFAFPEDLATWVITKVAARTGGAWGNPLVLGWTRGERKIGRPTKIKVPSDPTHYKCPECTFFVTLVGVGRHRYDCRRPEVVLTPDTLIYPEPVVGGGQVQPIGTAAQVARRRNGRVVRDLLRDAAAITPEAPGVCECEDCVSDRVYLASRPVTAANSAQISLSTNDIAF